MGAKININGRYALLANGGVMPWMAWMDTHAVCPGVTELDMSLIPDEAFDEKGNLDYDEYTRTIEERKAKRAAKVEKVKAEVPALPDAAALSKMSVVELKDAIKAHFGVDAKAGSKGMLIKQFNELADAGNLLE